MICTLSTELCPVTSIDIVDDGSGTLSLSVSKEASNLPLTNFKFSTDTPCVSDEQEPIGTAGTFRDEYTTSAQGCQKNEAL